MYQDRDTTAFAAGAIGEPGSRTFLLQFTGSFGQHTYLLEKSQVAELAKACLDLLDSVAEPDVRHDPPDLHSVEQYEFRVGALGVEYLEEGDVVQLTIGSVDEADPHRTYTVASGMVRSTALEGLRSVAGGRPPCPHCGLALDPDGHACPATNGDLRHHQP